MFLRQAMNLALVKLTMISPSAHRPVGLVVKASSLSAEDPVFESHLRRDFSGSSHTNDLKIGTPVLPCQALGVLGSALGLIGLVSVYCDWVR